jgi:hypothetical protein
VVPELLQLTLNVFQLQSIVCDSGEPLLVYIAAFRIAVADFETVLCLARKCVEASVRGNELHTTMLYLTSPRKTQRRADKEPHLQKVPEADAAVRSLGRNKFFTASTCI